MSLNQITRKGEKVDRFNIVGAPIHEAFQTAISKTRSDWFLLSHPHFKKWDTRFRPLPPNFYPLGGPDFSKQLQTIEWVSVDLLCFESVFGHAQLQLPISRYLHCPTLRIEHTTTMPNWSPSKIEDLKQLRGDINVFITDHSRREWKFSEDEARVIEHGIDTEVFKPDLTRQQPHILSCVNDFKNRGNILGYPIWEEVVKGLPHKILGNTPGLSEPAKDLNELILNYQSSSIFLNTSLYSPIPMSVLEAAACGCTIISTETCAIPEIFEHGKNALLSNNPKELRGFAEDCLRSPTLVQELGGAARKLVLERFNLDRFVSDYNKLFEEVSQMFYTG